MAIRKISPSISLVDFLAWFMFGNSPLNTNEKGHIWKSQTAGPWLCAEERNILKSHYPAEEPHCTFHF